MDMPLLVIRVDLAISNHLGYPSIHGDALEGWLLTGEVYIHALRLPADMEY